jgi:hypothetical protein
MAQGHPEGASNGEYQPLNGIARGNFVRGISCLDGGASTAASEQRGDNVGFLKYSWAE